MRRPRHKLQISTFPFLAVLLGAMGSLIFLLLVMDRRAKIVARNKVRDAQAARMAAAASAEQARRDEWERQRRQLHETLAAQDQALRGQLQNALAALQGTEKQLTVSASIQEQLRTRINTEQQRLQQQRDEVRRRQAAVMQSNQAADASKIELAKLTRDLLDLEQTLDGLRRLRDQRQPTYSLVPYRGQRGGNRMPIYIECSAAGLVFLPDGQRLGGSDVDIPAIRAEVERRHGPLVKAARANPFQPNPADEQPYVLFLVRPDGIGSYYRGQNALRGYQIDYGYELVDAAWTLDVPSPADWKYVAPAPPTIPEHSTVVRLPGNNAGPVIVNESTGQANGASGNGAPGGSSVPTGVIGSARLGPPGPGSGLGNAASGAPPNPLPGRVTGTTSGPTIGFSANSAGNGDQTVKSGLEKSGLEKPPVGPVLPPNDPTTPTGAAVPAFRPAQPKGPPVSPLESAAPGLKIPGAVAHGEGAPPDARARQQGTTSPPSNAGESPPPGAAMSRLALPSTLPDKQEKTGPVSLSRVIGNRDFVVTIACYREGVVVTPGGASFAWNDKGGVNQIDEALVRTVLQLIERRQATVRAGEPPYRAVLRFEVRGQGRRTYHHVFPVLDGLRLPMVREDVED
jgi:hypothetical protein